MSSEFMQLLYSMYMPQIAFKKDMAVYENKSYPIEFENIKNHNVFHIWLNL